MTSKVTQQLKRKSKPNLLFVDDEKRVLNSMRALFKREYNLFLTTKGQEAIEIIEKNNIDVVVADQRMPTMTGVELLSQVKVSSPNTIRILLTGYANVNAIEGAINGGEVYRFLSKPCAVDELRGTIREAADVAIETAQQSNELADIKKNDREFMTSLANARVKPSLASRLNEMMKGLHKDVTEESDSVDDNTTVGTKEATQHFTKSDVATSDAPSFADNENPNTNAKEDKLKVAKHAHSSHKPQSLTDIITAPATTQESEKAMPREQDDDFRTAPTLTAPSLCEDPPAIHSNKENETSTSIDAQDSMLFNADLESDQQSELDQTQDQNEQEILHQLSQLTPEENEHEPFDVMDSLQKELTKLNSDVAVPVSQDPTDFNSDELSASAKLRSVPLEETTTKVELLANKVKAIIKRNADQKNIKSTTATQKTIQEDDHSSSDQVESAYENEVIHKAPTFDKELFAKLNDQNGAPKPASIPHLDKASNDTSVNKTAASDTSENPFLSSDEVTPITNDDEPPSHFDYNNSVEIARLNKESIEQNGNEDSVDIVLGGNTHQIIDLTDSVEIIMSGNTHTTLDSSITPLQQPTPADHYTSFDDSACENPQFQDLNKQVSLQHSQQSAKESTEEQVDPTRMRVVGTGKYKVAVVVFTGDKKFAHSIGKSLQGFFYTFHAVTVAQLTHAINHVDPAVLITDIGSQPELIQQLMARLKRKVPEMVTMVASKERDADLMVKLINHGQVFRMVDKPMSATACKMYVREALKKHVQLRKNPNLMKHHKALASDDPSKLPSNITRLISSISRVRTAFSRKTT